MSQTPLSKHLLDPAMLDGVLSIEGYLRPSLRGPGGAIEEAGERLAAGGLVVIRDAFQAAFAERMHRSLDSCTAWRVYEGYEEHFHYHHHNVYLDSEYPPDIAWCCRVFDSASTKAWATRLSGRQCVGRTVFSASWYLPGDHSLPHTDAVRAAPTPIVRSPSCGISPRTGNRSGAALCTGAQGRLSAAGLQYARAFQRRAGNGAFRDACLALRPRQAPRHQRMVDGTGLNGKAGRASAGPDRRWRSANRNLLNIPPS